MLIEGNDSIAELFDRSLFYIQPVLMKEGFEYWELGSWEKKLLIQFYDNVRSIAQVKMLKLKRESLSVFIQQAVPNLTEKQRTVLEWALENGYYKYPWVVSVMDLAKKAKIPRTTFQEHLRKAEERVMNILIEPLK